MEKIRNLAEKQGEQIKTFSENQPHSTKIGKPTGNRISTIEHAAIFSILNRSRLANGWTTRTARELDPTIRVWSDVFKHYGIPAENPGILDKLYYRALDARQTFLQNGKEPPMLTAELIAAGWTGQNGLKAEIEARRVASGRTLTGFAQSRCPKCYGSGWEYLKDSSGREIGVKGRCDHICDEPAETESEPEREVIF